MKKMYLASKEAYLRGQYKEVSRAFEGVIIEACKFKDVKFCREDLERIMRAVDKEDETKDIFVRPVSIFLANHADFPVDFLDDLRKKYLAGYMNTIPHLSSLSSRFSSLGIPFEEWQFKIRYPLPSMTRLCWVEDDVLDKYLKEASHIELSEQQCKMMELTHTVCELVNSGFLPMNYIDYDNEKGGSVVQEDRLINDILKQCS